MLRAHCFGGWDTGRRCDIAERLSCNCASRLAHERELCWLFALMLFLSQQAVLIAWGKPALAPTIHQNLLRSADTFWCLQFRSKRARSCNFEISRSPNPSLAFQHPKKPLSETESIFPTFAGNNSLAFCCTKKDIYRICREIRNQTTVIGAPLRPCSQ